MQDCQACTDRSNSNQGGADLSLRYGLSSLFSLPPFPSPGTGTGTDGQTWGMGEGGEGWGGVGRGAPTDPDDGNRATAGGPSFKSKAQLGGEGPGGVVGGP